MEKLTIYQINVLESCLSPILYRLSQYEGFFIVLNRNSNYDWDLFVYESEDDFITGVKKPFKSKVIADLEYDLSLISILETVIDRLQRNIKFDIVSVKFNLKSPALLEAQRYFIKGIIEADTSKPYGYHIYLS